MSMTMETVFGLAGGLAMFLFGMNMMSEALQKAAGEKMKKILALLTKNPVLGVLAGTLVTAVLQSSSATTVMIIGFVSAGLMTLPQAISVILGANIGTTMTAQLMAFKISDYIWLIVFVGFIISFLCKNEKIKSIGQTIFAFGVLFVGIETMGSVMKPLASSPVFLGMIEKVSHVPILGVCVGALMTLVVQSSSATIAVLQNFASQAGPDGVSSVIGLAGAIPILLGDNIGTTITAILASIGQSKNAKRTAIAHSIFNITGSVIFVCIIPWYAKFVEWVSPKGPEVEVISRQIANAHTTFNVACTLLWLPFIWVLVKVVTFLIRGEDKTAEDDRLSRFLDTKIINQPVFAIKLVTEEIEDISMDIRAVLESIQKVLVKSDAKLISDTHERSRNIGKRIDETIQYLALLFSAGSLTEDQAAYTSDMLVVLESIDHISKRCIEISDFGYEKLNKKYEFSDEAKEELKSDISTVVKMYGKVLDYMKGTIDNPVKELAANKEKLVKMRNKIRSNNAKRMQQKTCKKASGELFNQILLCLERISYDCYNLLENGIGPFRIEDTVSESHL
ncbi:MAG: Na/Pi cotransporter family protein [bacterium]|nr:Na/Pi cotransporter family protein [bacterium]